MKYHFLSWFLPAEKILLALTAHYCTLVVRKYADSATGNFLLSQPQQQPGTQEQAHDVAPGDGPSPGSHKEQPAAHPHGDLERPVPGTSTEPSTEAQNEPATKEGELIEPEEQPKNEGADDGGGSDGEEGKGQKRKREEVHGEEDSGKSPDKKRVQKSLFGSVLVFNRVWFDLIVV